MIQRALENGIRHKKKTILNLLICCLTVILLNAYMGNIAGIKQQLSELPKVVKVDGVISNLNGTLSSGLKIKEQYIDGVMNSEYITDPVFSMQLKMGFGSFAWEDYPDKLNYYAAGITAVDGIPGFLEEEIIFGGKEEGMEKDLDAREFFSSSERLCIVDEAVAKEQGVKLGEKIPLTIAYYRYGNGHEIFIEPLETEDYVVAGFMNMENYKGTGDKPDVIFPFETVRMVFHEAELEFFADTGAFLVKDPYKLNELKQEMHDLQFMEVIPAAEYQYDGNALIVRDETFIQAAEQLLRNEALFTGMLPFMGIAILCIGYVTASLLMRGRRAEYAIMRSLGQSYGSCFFTLCLEYGFTALAGCFAGSLCSLVFLKGGWQLMVSVTGAFMCCYVLGEGAALLPLRRLSVMTVLSKND